MRPETPAYDMAADQQLADAISASTHPTLHAVPHGARRDADRLDRPARTSTQPVPVRSVGDNHSGPQVRQPPYVDDHDADYQVVRQLVDAAVKKAWSFPRRDLLGLLPEADTAEARVVAGR